MKWEILNYVIEILTCVLCSYIFLSFSAEIHESEVCGRAETEGT